MGLEIVPSLETNDPDVSIGGCLMSDLGSGPEQVGDKECRDHATYEQPPMSVKSFVKGVDEEYEPGFSVPEHLEHRATNDLSEVDTNMETVEKVQKEYSGHAAYEQPTLQVKSFVKGVDDEYEPGISMPENLEHRATNGLNEADINMENVEEVHKEAADTEIIEPQEQELDQELNSDSSKHQSKEENSQTFISKIWKLYE